MYKNKIFKLVCLFSLISLSQSAVNAQNTVLDEFKDFDSSRAGLVPNVSLFSYGWRENFVNRTTPNNIIDEISFVERNLNFATGRTRKVRLLSLPVSSPGGNPNNKTNSFNLDNRRATMSDGSIVDGRFDMATAAGSAAAFELIYDNDGAGLGVNFSKATSLDMLWNTDTLGSVKDSIVALTLTDSSGRSFTKTYTYKTLTVVKRDVTLPFPLSEYATQINLANISQIKLYIESGWAQDSYINSLSVNTNPYRISGNAKIRGTQIPVRGASVSATTGTTVLPGTTGQDGNYLISDVTDGSYSMSISKPGYVLVGTNFVNPVVINGQNRDNVNFEFDCAPGFVLQGQECLPRITIDASDGTFTTHVLVNWVGKPDGSICQLSRRLSEGTSTFSVIATGISGTTFSDTTAVPGTKYLYQVNCGGVTSDENEGFRLPENNTCPTGSDCIESNLEPSACSSANGFLNQINIASVINRLNTTLDATVEYRDLEGVVRGSVRTRLQPYQKQDFIINDLGLAKDTYGTVCVNTNAVSNGAWGGGVALYKADFRAASQAFGDSFDFVLYYPYRNAQVGSYTQPVNTSHFGVRQDGTVANWVRITDAVKGDGERLRGILTYTDAKGSVIHQDIVNVPDGGRFDYAGHEAIGTFKNFDNIGMVRFSPTSKSDGSAAKYYMDTGRYFYDCVGATCGNFYTAFVVPNRPSTDASTAGGISTIDGETTVLEINNNNDTLSSDALIRSFNASGFDTSTRQIIPPNGTTHVTVNKTGSTGILASNSIGSASITSLAGKVATTTIFYKLDQKGVLQYAYAAPQAAPGGNVQFSEFNSFIGNSNFSEIFNSGDTDVNVLLQARDASNNVVVNTNINVRAFSTVRTELNVPKDTYGTVVIQSSSNKLAFRTYIKRSDYAISFRGE